MLEPADLLLLDEPTNDLDIATLEILEESLLEYTGALVLVTHDRYMLDRVSTIVLGLDGRGGAERFADYSQWEREAGGGRGAAGEEIVPASIVPGQTGKAVASAAPASGPASANGGKKKLSYLEAREYAGIEAAVEAAEDRLQAAREMLEDPAVAIDAARLTAALAEMEAAQESADSLYARWAELTEKAG
jgi:ATP-binding cassette subfamily F protein uup